VRVEDEVVGRIGPGMLVLLGVGRQDSIGDADYLVSKLIHLRIFQDSEGKMNRSLAETGGQMLVVSQFTLLGDCRKGRRPSYGHAADPETAKRLYEYLVQAVKQAGVWVETGRFGASMAVSLVNDGPVTLIVDSK
jgi:D-tyrosyl-tRNA(Tyr) deacylase